MKQAERSTQTKNAFSRALLTRLIDDELDDVSVADLARDCNLDRKTFYYHFDDVYALFDWTVHEMIREAGVANLLREDPRRAITICADFVLSRPELAHALKSPMGRLHLKGCLASDIYAAVEYHLRHRESDAGVELESGYRSFLVVMLGHAVGETFVELASGGIALSPKRFADYLVATLRATVDQVIATAEGGKR
ncbi:MAG: hypothetical protein IJH04_08985 [Eggerthellaceae bacterium]|nr:hypothetical protein [Eggerthellaceae bacterium]